MRLRTPSGNEDTTFGRLKRCPKCKTEKDVSCFNADNYSRVKDGLSCWCRECRCTDAKNRRLRNIAREREKDIIRYQENKEAKKLRVATYRKNNRDKVNVYLRRVRSENPKEKFACLIGNALRRCLKSKNGTRWGKLLGYSAEELQKRLKSTLPENVTWDDYMNKRVDLHIDHIVPISAFNFETPDDLDFKRCWSLKNLRLIHASENLAKQNRLNSPFNPCLLLEVPHNG